MLEILSITGPIYLIIMIGFFAVRFELFSKADMRVLGKLVINLALPCLLFTALSERAIGEIVRVDYLAAYATGTLAVIANAFFWSRCVAKQPAPAGAYVAMGMSSSNSSFVGFPILLLTLPAVAPSAFALNLMVENLLVLPLLLLIADASGQGGVPPAVLLRQLARRLVTNPLIIALVLGLAAALLQLKLPTPLARTATMFAQASGVLSLLVIGGTLYGLQMRGLAGRVLPVVLGKLVLHPLLVFAAFSALPWFGFTLPGEMKQAGVLLAAMPVMSIYPIFAQRHGLEGDAAATLLLTTLGSFLTLNLLLTMLHAGWF